MCKQGMPASNVLHDMLHEDVKAVYLIWGDWQLVCHVYKLR